jgi:hypothetical protein
VFADLTALARWIWTGPELVAESDDRLEDSPVPPPEPLPASPLVS